MATEKRIRWVLLAFRLPREPSTPRIATWRKLKRLGVAQLLDGLVALPFDARNREQLEWVAEEVIDAGGKASIWLAEPTTVGQEREMASELAANIADEYRVIVREAESVQGEPLAVRRRTLARLRREMRRIRQRDYFPPIERERARAAVEELASLAEVAR